MEHILGRKGALSDPEHLRLRAQAAWKYQGKQRVSLKGPLLLINTTDGEVEESEDTVQTLEEAIIDENKTITEVENAEQSEEEEILDVVYSNGGGDGDHEGSGVTNSTLDEEDEYDSNSGNYSYTEESVAVDNDLTSEIVERDNETISNGMSEGEGNDIQERTGDALTEEDKEEIMEVTVEEGTRLRLVCNVTGVKHIWVSTHTHTHTYTHTYTQLYLVFFFLICFIIY